MARIRTIKPDFWDSPDTREASMEARLMYIAMWNWADDYGIGDGNHARLVSFAFPNGEIPVSDYPRLLSEVSRTFGVVFFDFEGRPFYVIPTWEKHQRTEKRAKERADLTSAARMAVQARNHAEVEHSDTGVGESAESLGESGAGTGELGNWGTGEADSLSAHERADHPDGSLIPDEWRPNEKHAALAKSIGADISREESKFREHAHKNARRMKKWDQGFTNWLNKAAVFAQQRRGAPSPQTFAQQKQANALALVDKYRMEEEREEVGSSDATHLRALGSGR